MNHIRSIAAASLAGVLLLSAPACSSDKSEDAKETTTTAAADDAHNGATSEPAADTTEVEGEGSEGGEEGTGTVTLADGEAAADKTITFTTDAGFDPSELEVAVGELFTFRAGDDSVNAVKFGDSSDTFTISGGLIESFTIDAPGTYTVTEDLSGETMTVTVS